MKIIHHLSEIFDHEKSFPDIGVTIGNFDGVHLGHRQILTKIHNDCKSKKLKFIVLTFVPHPQKILRPENDRFMINNYEDRRKLLSQMGVDYLVEINFTRDFSTLTAEKFINDFLLIYPRLSHLYLGHDFAFGANKAGRFDIVTSLCTPRGIEVEIQPKYYLKDQLISSSLVRDLVSSGQVHAVKEILARPFFLSGVVIKGEGRGKKMGYPTANIQFADDQILPSRGVYITQTTHHQMVYKSVTNIGFNPTFKTPDKIHVETNIFDFDFDIYGETIQIAFLEKIRDEKKFPTVNDLISQIKSDAEQETLKEQLEIGPYRSPSISFSFS
jgi:riboflavin kinase / FMN adenylyltransferase